MNARPGAVAVPEQVRASFSGSLIDPGDDGYDTARGRELEIAVRGGGHNVAGKAVTDGGLMIDLSPMKGIHVDARRRTVRAQPGLTWREFNRAAGLHGMATPRGSFAPSEICVCN